jgi:hypothetical protein
MVWWKPVRSINILGVDIESRKDVLDLYTVESEGAQF